MAKVIATFPEHDVWVEKYRPVSISDCILSASIRTEMEDILKKGKIPNALFSGKPGCGKTTSAIALCKQLDFDYDIVNASSERGLDLIRDRIMGFASSVSLSGSGKCFILDEADQLPAATQKALNNASEVLSSNCTFIMTANYPGRIIPALRSRFPQTNFDVKDKKEIASMQAQFYKRCVGILEAESVEYDPQVLIKIVQKFYPDNRLILGMLQKYGRQGKITENILLEMKEVSADQFIQAIKEKKFKDINQFAADNAHTDTSGMYEKVYNQLKNFVKPESIPDAIIIINDYQRYDTIVPSKQIHIVAMAMEMTGLDFI